MSRKNGNNNSVDLDIGTLSGHLWEAATIGHALQKAMRCIEQAIENWQESSMAVRESMNGLFAVLEQQTDHFRSGTEMVLDQFPDVRN